MTKILNYLIFLLLPTYLIKIDLFAGASVNFLDILLLATISANLFWIFKHNLLEKFLSFDGTVKISLALILFGFYSSLVLNASKDNLVNALGVFKSFLLLPVLFGWTASFLVSKNFLKIKHFVYAYLVMSSSLSILSIVAFRLNKTTFDGRIELFFGSPNYLAMLLAPAIPLLVFLIKKNSAYIRYFLLFILFIHTFSTITTLSLGSILALLILVPVMLISVIFVVDTKKLQFWLVLGALAMSFVLLFSQKISTYTKHNPYIAPTSVDSRIVIYEVSRQLFVENCFWGIGPGSFQAKYLSKQADNPPFPQWAVPHPHNNFLLTLLEGGSLAFLGFLLLLLKKWEIKKTPFGVPLFLILVYFLVHGVIDTTIWKNDLATLFWFILLFFTVYPQVTSKK